MLIFTYIEKISILFQTMQQLFIFLRKYKRYLVHTIVLFIEYKFDKISVA
jgi:hypothetical protein